METLPEKRRGGKPFVKGHDPRRNPMGRPAGQTPIADLLRRMQLEKMPDGKTYRTALAKQIWALALNGEEWAVKFIADRTEGKVKDVVDMNHGIQPAKPIEEMSDDELGQIIARAKPVQPCPPD
jgi:hypothetical protein